MRDFFQEKKERIRKGSRPRVLDLFAGCGGFSLGFKLGGFSPRIAVEYDMHASRSHAINFHRNLESDLFELHAKPKDITEIEPIALLRMLRIEEEVEDSIDVLVGGPPCQAFARVGRAKLREVAKKPQAYLSDPRSNLYLRYLHYVERFKPLAVVMENVPDVLNFGGHNIAEETCEFLNDIGYSCRYTLLNSVFYGVPQMRERMILIALHKSLSTEIQFPLPTHWTKLPIGYEGTRRTALKFVQSDKTKLEMLPSRENHFVEVSRKKRGNIRPAVSVLEALGDLPVITKHLEGKLKRGARRFDELCAYPRKGISELLDYQKLMRTWPGFENEIGILDHVIRYLPRDYPIFREMEPGDQYPQALLVAERLFERDLEKKRSSGQLIDKGSEAYDRARKKFVPPYSGKKFPNKWRKLEPNQPSRTLMAHLGKDSYSHIHYDSEQARTISVREAARLQSFPDGFVFSGTMNPAFRQIGNAVPPLMAAAIAKEIYTALIGKSNEPKTCIKETSKV